MKVKITSDSTCDLPAELIEKYGISILPLTVALGDEIHHDGVDLDTDTIFKFVEANGTLPMTSAVNVDEYLNEFKKWTDEGFEVVHISLSSELSSCCRNAMLAAEMLGNVKVIDSRNLSTGQGLLTITAAEMALNGADSGSIVEKCNEMIPKIQTSFVINTLDYLYKGGRCSALSAFGANLLHIKPFIAVKDGTMTPGKKYRGKIASVIANYTEDTFKGRDDIDRSRIILTSTGCPQKVVEDTKKQLLELMPDIGELIIAVAGCTISTHCGPNSLGIIYALK